MNNVRQPRIRYRTSIWLFSFLILVLFGVFSIGVVVNVLQWGKHWTQTELKHFVTTSQSLSMLLRPFEVSEIISADGTNAEALDELNQLLHPYRLNTMDRVYFIFRHRAIQVLPEYAERPELEKYSLSNPFWNRGWEGIRSLTAEYVSWDGSSVVASIVPEDFTLAGPSVLIVFERNRVVFDWPERRIAGFLVLSVIGLIFAYILVLYYGRKMLQPYSRLAEILSDAASVKPGLNCLETDFRDPVQRAIETFAASVSQLREQANRLEYLGDRLEHPMSRMDAYEEELLAKVNTGIITFDQNRVIQTLTSKIPQLLRLTVPDVRGSTCDQVLGSDSEISQILTMALEDHRVVHQHHWKWNTPDGQPVWLSVSTTMIRTPEGEISGVGCVIRDVTLLKLLRLQVREKEHLAALGELSAGVAHEFRNPLGAIQGNAQYLVESLADEELKNVAGEIYQEVRGLERIIRDFLTFARPLKPDVSTLDLQVLFKEESVAMERQFGEDLRISIQSDDDPAMADLDENLFRQVIRNILLNACQAMNGRGEIRITMEPMTLQGGTDGGTSYLLIRISDSGPGIDKAHLEEVFKPFHTGRPDGVGLGLAIVKKIVLAHNGFVEFEKSEMPGAILRMIIPKHYDPEKTAVFKRVTRDDLE